MAMAALVQRNIFGAFMTAAQQEETDQAFHSRAQAWHGPPLPLVRPDGLAPVGRPVADGIKLNDACNIFNVWIQTFMEEIIERNDSQQNAAYGLGHVEEGAAGGGYTD